MQSVVDEDLVAQTLVGERLVRVGQPVVEEKAVVCSL